MVTRWSNYIADGTFSLSVPKDTPLGGKGGKGRLAEFWTTPYPYWDMQERDRELWNDLRNSSLVVFKVRKKRMFPPGVNGDDPRILTISSIRRAISSTWTQNVFSSSLPYGI